jgi:hypothetical protein
VITAVVTLVLGLLLGTLVAYRLFLSAATATSRRTLAQLQDTLEGLESAYRIEVAMLDARREIAGLPSLPSMPSLPAHEARAAVHVPRRFEDD